MPVSLPFILLRLRNTSFLELTCRIRQFSARLYLNCLTALGRQIPNVPKTEADAVASLIMADLFLVEDLFSAAPVDLGSPQGVTIPSADSASLVADIRLIWEPARLQQAIAMLLYANHHPDSPDWKIAEQAAKDMILSWLKANPFPKGDHYRSAMECALRIPVFLAALKQIDALSPKEHAKILKAIYRHAWLVSNQLSLYSSLGNHTITEAVGLVFAGAVYRSTSEGRQWLDTGIGLLTDELAHQVLDDGGPAEQSLGYHRFVLDLYWLAIDFIHKNKLGNVEKWKPRLSAGESFLSAFQVNLGCFPAIGDWDDGVAVAPGISPCRNAGYSEDVKKVTFRQSGYSVIRNKQLVFTFDHGPLGMAPFYNHGHADALSITLSKNGCSMLVDPGTYRYNGAQRWRRYFKGTRAHNTVTIDDQDQAIQETSFIWSQPYDVELTTYREKNGDLFYHAVHDGYTRLEAPVRHQRSVFFFDQENLLIKDRFVGSGIHCFQLNFHLHPSATVVLNGKWWVVDQRGEQIFLRLFEGDFQVVRGQNNPLMGWYSCHYGQKEPARTLTYTRTGFADSVVFTTAICTRLPLGADSLDIKVDELEGKIKNT